MRNLILFTLFIVGATCQNTNPAPPRPRPLPRPVIPVPVYDVPELRNVTIKIDMSEFERELENVLEKESNKLTDKFEKTINSSLERVNVIKVLLEQLITTILVVGVVLLLVQVMHIGVTIMVINRNNGND